MWQQVGPHRQSLAEFGQRLGKVSKFGPGLGSQSNFGVLRSPLNLLRATFKDAHSPLQRSPWGAFVAALGRRGSCHKAISPLGAPGCLAGGMGRHKAEG